MKKLKQQAVAYRTIIAIEIKRIFRIWPQTLLPPAITTILYFIIFGHVIGSRVGQMNGFPYIQYIAPGLMMMNIITSAYASTVSGFFGAKFQRSIEEILVSSCASSTILLGYMSAGVMRGLLIGGIVLGISLCFVSLPLHSTSVILAATFFSACIFSLAGIINAVFSKSFYYISIISTFFFTPPTY